MLRATEISRVFIHINDDLLPFIEVSDIVVDVRKVLRGPIPDQSRPNGALRGQPQ